MQAGSQPDWYMGFTDGAVRLMPGTWPFNWEVNFFGLVSVPFAILLPVAFCGVLFMAMFAYPWLERWVTGDDREHHVLDRPRNAPARTALGAAAVTSYSVMLIAASGDLIATHFHLAVNDVIYILRTLFFLGPILAFIIVRRICLSLQRKDREIVLHGRETGRVQQLAHGEFIEVHAQLDEYDRYRLVSFYDYQPTAPQPNARGRVTVTEKTRSRLSQLFFEDRVSPVTPAELDAAHREHHEDLGVLEADDSTSERRLGI